MPKVHRELRIIPKPPVSPTEYLGVMEREGEKKGWKRGDFLHVIHPGRSVDSLWSDTDAFHREFNSSLEMVVLAIGDNDLTLSNIVCFSRDLTVDDFNSIAEAFRAEVVEPAAEQVAAEIDFTSEFESLEDHLDPISFEKLRQFCALANKSSRALHPLDRDRWIDFLTSAYRTDSELDVQLLKNWLIEEGGWSSEIASFLAAEFSFGRRLCSRFAEEVSK